jgi:mRNA-degrading endonuclease RelE of RelBE toxin-antitoxin system
MEYEIHESGLKELKELPEEARRVIKEDIEARRKRDNPITSQRGTGIAYDNHGEPIHYFKVEDNNHNYRVFFEIDEENVVLLGFRPRDDDTYLNIREYTKRTE